MFYYWAEDMNINHVIAFTLIAWGSSLMIIGVHFPMGMGLGMFVNLLAIIVISVLPYRDQRRYGPGIENMMRLHITEEPLATEIAKVKKGIFDINQKFKWGFTLLHLACIEDNKEVVEHLLKEFGDEINVNAMDDQGVTPLIRICSHGSPKSRTMPLLLAHPKIDVNSCQSHYKVTALMAACAHMSTHNIETLMLYGKDLNVKQRDAKGLNAFSVPSHHLNSLLGLFHQEPQFTTYLIRKWRDDPRTLAAELFVAFTMLCGQKDIPENLAHFCKILVALPVELRVLICNMRYGINDAMISDKVIAWERRIISGNFLKRRWVLERNNNKK
jgi:hypothetical protein